MPVTNDKTEKLQGLEAELAGVKKKDGKFFLDNVQLLSLEPESFNEEDYTIKVKYTNNNKVLRYNWWTDELYYLQISKDPSAANLQRLNSGAAVLDSHDSSELKNIIGCVVKGSATHQEATIRFSKREEVKSIVEDVKAGIISFVSPGFFIHATKDVTTKEDKYRTLEVIDWEPYEISFVATPADPEAQAFAMQEEARAGRSKELVDQKNKEQNTMPSPNEKKETAASASTTQTATETVDKEKLKAEAVQEERNRTDTILSIVKKHNLKEDFAQSLIKSGKSVEEAQAAVLDELAKDSEKEELNGLNITGGESAKEKHQTGARLALEARVGRQKFENGNKFNNMSLFEVAKVFAADAGANVDSMTRSQIADFALSTSDFSDLLANVAVKSLRKAYDETPRTFLPFCNRVTLTDFKPVSRIQLSEVPTPTQVTEGGEFKQAAITDGKETYKLATYGEIISITRQTIINDDLNALSRIPAMMGAAAARLEGDIVYGILTGNAAMADGYNLFSSEHANLTDALLLNEHATLNYFKHFVALFRKQKGSGGVANLGLYPNYLIVGPDQEVPGAKLLRPIQAVETDKSNVFAGSSQLIVETRLTGNSYYGAANPNMIDTIDYGYLEGEEGPQISTKNGFEVDGMQIKMRQDFVAAAVDYRGLGKSTNNDS